MWNGGNFFYSLPTIVTYKMCDYVLQEYSVKHLIGLISATCQNNKKTRQRLIALVEEQRSSR